MQHRNYSNNIKKAKTFEKQQNYKEAIYNYAIAILNSPQFGNRKIYTKIKELSNKYGPFNYDDILEKEIKKYGDAPEKCAEAGHAGVISIINEANNKDL